MAIYGTLAKPQSPGTAEVDPVHTDDEFQFNAVPETTRPESSSGQ